MLGYLSLDIICSSKLTVFPELRSRKTVRFSEQINVRGQISEHIFAPNEGYCLFIVVHMNVITLIIITRSTEDSQALANNLNHYLLPLDVCYH